MKICVISPLFEPWLVGGAEKYVSTLARELSSKNEVVVITTKGPKPRNTTDSGDNPKIFEINPKNITSFYEIINSSKIGKVKKNNMAFV